MSIILKGIDMPKCSNEDIMVVIRRNKAEVWQTGYKERTVEAIQIDRPHGRIIDEKELLDKIKRGRYSEDINQVIYSVGVEDIANAPTILDEEGE